MTMKNDLDVKRFIWYSFCTVLFTTVVTYGILNGVWIK